VASGEDESVAEGTVSSEPPSLSSLALALAEGCSAPGEIDAEAAWLGVGISAGRVTGPE
jgi:hypothetical protein